MENKRLPGGELCDEVIKVLNGTFGFRDMKDLVRFIRKLDRFREEEKKLTSWGLLERLDKLIDVLSRFSKNIKAQDLYMDWEGRKRDFED